MLWTVSLSSIGVDGQTCNALQARVFLAHTGLHNRSKHFTAKLTKQHRKSRNNHAMQASALADEDTAVIALPILLLDGSDVGLAAAASAALALGGAAAVWFAVRFALYARIQYITAALLGNRVPRGGKVIQIGGSSRDLYYLPTDTVQVTVVDPKGKEGYWKQAGITAGVPTILNTQTPQTLLFAPDSSVAAVVATTPLTAVDDIQRFIKEVTRVLKPGGAFVFMQRLRGGGPLQTLLGNGGNCIDAVPFESALEGCEGAYDQIEVDVVLPGLDSHVVGVAIKSAKGAGAADDEESAVLQRSGAKQQKAKQK